MCPFFNNKEVPVKAVPQQMLNYLLYTKRNLGNGKNWRELYPQKKCWCTPPPPLLRWYVDHGAVITRISRTIDDQPKKIFTWFVEQVTEARCTGDVEKSNVLFADVFKLLGNSGYEKLIDALERHTNVIYTKD